MEESGEFAVEEMEVEVGSDARAMPWHILGTSGNDNGSFTPAAKTAPLLSNIMALSPLAIR